MKKVTLLGVDVNALPRLKRAEADELLIRIKNGDKKARDLFITANIRLVLSVIKRFSNAKSSADDMFQSGCIGLIKAIENFDTSLGVAFSTYAVPMIMGEIKRFLRDVNSLRIPRSIRDTAFRALKAREAIELNNEDASVDRIAEELGVTAFDVTYALDAISDTVSLYEPVYSKDGDNLLLMDQITEGDVEEDRFINNVDLKNALSLLPERERNIVYLRYYKGRTQTEISKFVGISQAQVSRLEKNALKMMKSYMA
ncbi:MAG: sigma-70 family RNA polymerase sigma factor [Clostridia bacterium]|nr:sigma-70 family RNA polymerase sigma factor [Clostridia bacterium]